jgi:hypothetical protein
LYLSGLLLNKKSKMILKFSAALIICLTISLISKGCVKPESSITSSEGNRSPVIKSVLLDPLFIKVGRIANITVEAEDPDGDALSYSWSSPLGDIIGSGPSVRYSAAYCCLGINTITVVVEDSRGSKVSEFINIEIVP